MDKQINVVSSENKKYHILYDNECPTLNITMDELILELLSNIGYSFSKSLQDIIEWFKFKSSIVGILVSEINGSLTQLSALDFVEELSEYIEEARNACYTIELYLEEIRKLLKEHGAYMKALGYDTKIEEYEV